MSLTLVLNAAEKRVQFLLLEENVLLCAQDWLANSGGTELLVPALATALARLGRQPEDIRKVACVTGPGSFTGLRLVLTTASALARSNQASLAALDYLQCLAATVPGREGQRVWVMVNARRGWYYHAAYGVRQGLPCLEGERTLRPITAGEARLPEGPLPDMVLGSALHGAAKELIPLLEEQGLQILPDTWDQPSPAALMRVTAAATWETKRDLEPVYLRECDAVENLDHIAPTLGLTPHHAQERLEALRQAPPSEPTGADH